MKTALFAFNGELVCFAHVLLNALDMKKRGHEVVVVIEGMATKLVKELHENSDKPFAPLYQQVKEAGLIAGVCMACSQKTGAVESAREQGLELCDEMAGHPSVARFMEEGYAIITF